MYYIYISNHNVIFARFLIVYTPLPIHQYLFPPNTAGEPSLIYFGAVFKIYLAQYSSFTKNVKALLVVFCFSSTDQAIPSAWVQYIKCVIDAYENSNCPLNGIDSQCGVPPRMLFHNDIDQNSHVVYNPTLILWNPLNQYHAHAILQCPIRQGRLRKWRWKDGSCARDNPRKLVGLQKNVFLVSCVYLCEKFQHEIIGHDPALLTSLRTRFPFLRIPFVLFHKSGVTRELYEFISSSIQTGLPHSWISRK